MKKNTELPQYTKRRSLGGRFLSILLVLSMLLTLLPVSTMAISPDSMGTTGEIIAFTPLLETAKTVPTGTSQEDLALPETLTAMVETVSEEVYEDRELILPVTWTSQPKYDMDTEGEYVFTPVIEGYTVSATVPVITVTVETAMLRGMVSPMFAIEEYDVWVGGVQVTSENTSGTGWSYDGDTNTLTLADANITYGGGNTIYTYMRDLIVVLNGTNSVRSTSSGDDCAFNTISGGSITFRGTGSLDASGKYGGIYAFDNLTIESGTISATGQKVGISCNRGSMIISGGNVTGTATTSIGYGIVRDHNRILNMTVSGDATVTAIGTNGARATSLITTTNPTHYVIAGDNESNADVVASPDASTWAKAYVKLIPGNTISGTITFGERGISGASVQLQKSGVDFGAPAITAVDGTYTTEAVPNGSYTIKVSKIGYIAADIAEFTVSGGLVADKDQNLTAEPLTGSVTISGTLKYGETLTATYGSGNNTGTLSYQWKRGDTNIGTGSTYTIVEADINQTLTCEITSTEQTGSVTSDATSTISKAYGSAVTGVSAVNCTSISNNDGKLIGVTIDMEYKINDAPDYIDGTSNDITGLTSGTYLVRVKETATDIAGAESTFTVGAYVPSVLTGTAKISNTSPRIGDELTGSLESGNNSGTLTHVWKADGVQVGTGESYTVVTADLSKSITLEISSSVETGTITSAPTAAVLKKVAPLAPEAPTMDSKTHNTVTLTANGAYQFSMDGTTWQTANVFSGLTASTAYTFYQRIAATADTEVSTASIGFSVTTNPKTGGSGDSSGGSRSGGSSTDNSIVIVIPPTPDKPTSPTQGEIKVPGTVDSKGNVTVNITNKTVTAAFDKALEDAKKKGNEKNGITVVLRVDTGSKTSPNATVNLPKAVQDTIIEKKIVNTIVVVDNPDITIGMDLTTVKEINKQANSDVNITATSIDSVNLTGEAKNIIGDRPVFHLKVNYGSGKQVQSFGAGSVSVTIPYSLGANEKADNVKAVYIDEKGNVHWLVNSVYDSVEKVLRFSTNHFSTYGVGYKEEAPAFTDIVGHWAKEDIEFVVSDGLFRGTSATTFSPNTEMTRGMFVTVLGRLAEADVSAYQEPSFNDVKQDDYYMGFIEWARENSTINGIGKGKFAPENSITREQMAVIMQNYAKSMGYTLPEVQEDITFNDSVKISPYAQEAVKQMQRAGVIRGKNNNILDPQGTATRAEASAVLHRFLDLIIYGKKMEG